MKTFEEELKEEIEKNQKILELLIQYPDLKRWKNGYLQSNQIISECQDVDFWHSCGCCSDAVLYAIPYIKKLGLKIYYDEISIGESNKYGEGYIKWNNWKNYFEELKFNNIIIEKIEKFFLENPAIDYEDEE